MKFPGLADLDLLTLEEAQTLFPGLTRPPPLKKWISPDREAYGVDSKEVLWHIVFNRHHEYVIGKKWWDGQRWQYPMDSPQFGNE